MNVKEARALLADASEEDPAGLTRSVLDELSVRDSPAHAAIQIGTVKDGVIHLEWEGYLRRDGQQFVADAEYLNTRKYWYSPLGLEQFMDLVRRAVETRQRTRGDVELQGYDDDGAYIQLTFSIATNEQNAARAFEVAQGVSGRGTVSRVPSRRSS